MPYTMSFYHGSCHWYSVRITEDNPPEIFHSYEEAVKAERQGVRVID